MPCVCWEMKSVYGMYWPRFLKLPWAITLLTYDGADWRAQSDLQPTSMLCYLGYSRNPNPLPKDRPLQKPMIWLISDRWPQVGNSGLAWPDKDRILDIVLFSGSSSVLNGPWNTVQVLACIRSSIPPPCLSFCCAFGDDDCGFWAWKWTMSCLKFHSDASPIFKRTHQILWKPLSEILHCSQKRLLKPLQVNFITILTIQWEM